MAVARLQRLQQMARWALVGLCLLLAACGSTVKVEDQQAAETGATVAGGIAAPAVTGGRPSGGTAVAGAAGGSAPRTPGQAAVSSPSGQATQGSGSTAALPAPAPVGGGGGPAAATVPSTDTAPAQPATQPAALPAALQGAPGITDTTIKIGVEVQSDGEATRAAFGIQPNPASIATEDAIAYMVEQINQRGGLAGRQIELIFHFTDLKEGTFAEQSQRACSNLAEDQHVFAVFSYATRDTETLGTCLAQRNTISFLFYTARFISLDALDAYPDHMFLPSGLTHTRSGFFIDALVRQGFLTPEDTIGILGTDDPVNASYTTEVVPARLQAHGLAATDTVMLTHPGDFAGISGSVAEVSNAVLRFRSLGIDRVVFTNTAGGGPLFFSQFAEQQNYRPKYGIASFDYAETAEGLSPDAQLEGARGAGWVFRQDVRGWDNFPRTPRTDECLELFAQSGYPEEAKPGEVVLCEAWFVMADALANVDAGAPTFRAAMQGLGEGYASPDTFPLHFGPDRRNEGIGTYRDLLYNTECQCFQYEGPDRSIP